MKTVFRSVFFTAILLFAAAAYGIPPINVTVSDSNSKIAFKGPTNANGTFATAELRPGPYVVQFSSKSPAVKADQFILILSAGKKAVISNAVAGEKFAAGVAVRIDVKSPKKMTGQVESARALGRDNVKVINGVRYFFVKGGTGSNFGGHWVDEHSLESPGFAVWGPDVLRQMQDRSNRGSMGVHEFGPGGR